MTELKRVLVIDDEPICLEQIELFLRNRFEVVKANNGEEGLETLRSGRPKIDLVLLDLMMPGISGNEVLQMINTDPSLKETKVIMQTGTSNKADVDKSIELGAKAYIIKPFKRAELVEEINKVLAPN